jgi:hypothetical protein
MLHGKANSDGRAPNLKLRDRLLSSAHYDIWNIIFRETFGGFLVAPRPSLHRILARPSPDLWANDELITLAEARALFFAHGPLSQGGLRSAIDRGELASKHINGKIFTTPGAVRLFTSVSLHGAGPSDA